MAHNATSNSIERRDVLAKYDANKDRKLDTSERSAMSEEDKAVAATGAPADK